MGICAGVLLGSILEGPRVLVRRWTEEVRTLELAAVPAGAGMKLEEFEALQVAAPPTAPVSAAGPKPTPADVPQTSAAPAVVANAPSSPIATPPDPPTKTAPDVRAADVPSTPDARSLIAAMKQRQAGQGDASPAARKPSGAVVQVAAYKDAKSADKLVAKLRKGGFDSYVSRSAPGAPEKFRVRVRPKRGAPIDGLASTLELRGYRIWVTRE